jgi:sensor histidine kinase YesM
MAHQTHMQQILGGWDQFVWWSGWMLAAPAMLMLIRRFPLVRGKIRHSIGGLLLGNGAIYLAMVALRFLLSILPDLVHPAAAQLPVDWSAYAVSALLLVPMDFLTYSGFFFASLAIDLYLRSHRQAEKTLRLQLAATQLQSDLSRSELTALRGQLQPHFLFNSFNAVASLVRQRRNEAAVDVIVQLSALLRMAIEHTGRQELLLDEEIGFIRHYLEIERVRFGEKLQVDLAVEASAAVGIVPNLVLQPLVENAIKHGIARRTRPGTIRLAARRVNDRLRIEIMNDGPEGPPPAPGAGEPPRRGIGLANTRQRLEKYYGPDHLLELTPLPDGGMKVNLDLPWRAAEPRPSTP